MRKFIMGVVIREFLMNKANLEYEATNIARQFTRRTL